MLLSRFTVITVGLIKTLLFRLLFQCGPFRLLFKTFFDQILELQWYTTPLLLLGCAICFELCVYSVPLEAPVSRRTFLKFDKQFVRRFIYKVDFAFSVFSLIPKPLSQSLPITVRDLFLAINARTLSIFIAPDSNCPIIAPRKSILLLLVPFEWSKFLVFSERLLDMVLREYGNW